MMALAQPQSGRGLGRRGRSRSAWSALLFRRRAALFRVLPGDRVSPARRRSRSTAPALKGERDAQGAFRRQCRAGPRLDLRAGDRVDRRCAPARRRPCSSRFHNRSDQRDAPRRGLQRDAGGFRRLVRQDFLLLLHRAASRAARDAPNCRSCSSSIRSWRSDREHGRRRGDHVVLHAVRARTTDATKPVALRADGGASKLVGIDVPAACTARRGHEIGKPVGGDATERGEG